MVIRFPRCHWWPVRDDYGPPANWGTCSARLWNGDDDPFVNGATGLTNLATTKQMSTKPKQRGLERGSCFYFGFFYAWMGAADVSAPDGQNGDLSTDGA
ncbi:hypothetical protein [Neobacillus niacini]|uniref:hypothetical protein n=1 Tax=Neobacillus niacini TaxID=86668 RepID=UPI0021CB1A4C|nr:hypothetical protein [Neobacillus niacini]MCM3763979.1 hypothetical protein [Neobacillus niacini]